MKHAFVVDENIFKFATETDDEQGRLCASFLARIARNCHRIVANPELWKKILRKLKDAGLKRDYALQEVVSLAAQLCKNSEKMIWTLDAPDLPDGIGVKDDDFCVVQSALPSKTMIVSTDAPLRSAINDNFQRLSLKAITPEEALELALDT
jgi:hypothetical protein